MVKETDRSPVTNISSRGLTTAKQAREWVLWSCSQCGVSTHTAQNYTPPWDKLPRRVLPSRHKTISQIKACNLLAIDSAQKVYSNRCKVAWHMHNVDYPPLGRRASYGVIAYAMGFKTRHQAMRAVRNWRVAKDRNIATTIGEE